MESNDTVKVDKRVDEILNTVKNLPGYVFELSADLGSGRNFSIRGNFDVGADLPIINGELDKLVKAVDRQLSKAVIPNIEEAVFQEEKRLKSLEADYAAADARRAGHKSLPLTEQANLSNQLASIEMQKEIVARKKALLEKTKKEAE